MQLEQLRDPLRGLVEPESFAWPVVELVRDRVELLLGVDAQVGALGEVLAQQPVGVLVGPALPGGVRSQE